MEAQKYKRVLIKISGEALAGDKHFGLNIGVHATYYLAQICIAWSLAFV